MSQEISTDSDTLRVIDLLRGASRGPQDPDVELAEMLPKLGATSDESAVILALERLVRDANPD
jgi:hypothetical protein